MSALFDDAPRARNHTSAAFQKTTSLFKGSRRPFAGAGMSGIPSLSPSDTPVRPAAVPAPPLALPMPVKRPRVSRVNMSSPSAMESSSTIIMAPSEWACPMPPNCRWHSVRS